ncbi:CLG1 [Candida jiufengensis]|uniref:CLG1 n=1 Tax=Candida jiufengensis TaxID=497108 RepID=UPI0022240452|nr:CLG1 [Candida jiufengensis]KAI5954240.1 CLG1 [Candida jiufengensis]
MNATYYPPQVSGHRATSSFHYAPTTTTNYQQPAPPPQQQSYYQHGHSQSYYQPPTQQVYNQQQQLLPPPPPQPIHFQAPPPMVMPINQIIPPPQAVSQNIPSQQQPQQQQEVNGGINSVLEYDLNQMSSFLGWCTFGMLKQQSSPSKDFENLISSVLFATRLPKSTIIIALEYMNQRFSSKLLSANLTEHEIFNYLVVSLVLANKFNDDNTFTNKSWCGATGLQLTILNSMEKIWLEEVKWTLSTTNFERNLQVLTQCWKTWCEKYGTDAIKSSSPLLPSTTTKTPTSTSFLMNPQQVYSTPTISPSSVNFIDQSSSPYDNYSYQQHYNQQQPYLGSSPVYQDFANAQYNQYYQQQSQQQYPYHHYNNFINQPNYNVGQFYMATC